jgi:hydroxyethylthiazole kinase
MFWNDLERIRAERPLVHNITNFVVMNLTANALLAAGASPVMAHAIEEVEEMAGMAGALVLNIGTLSGPWIQAMELAGRTALAKGIPTVLDPVGAGATTLRTRTALDLLERVRPAILRGNASEIQALAFQEAGTKGVDATHGVEEVIEAARYLSRRWGCVVTVSGPVDLVLQGDRVLRIHNGDPIMARVTGMGCTASALTGAFAAVNPDPFLAAAGAMALLGVAGELALPAAAGPGTFPAALLDALAGIRREDVDRLLRLEAGVR